MSIGQYGTCLIVGSEEPAGAASGQLVTELCGAVAAVDEPHTDSVAEGQLLRYGRAIL